MATQLDSELLTLLEPFKKEDYAYLASDENNAQRFEFIEGRIDEPELTYGHITDDVLHGLHQAIERLALEVEYHSHRVVRMAYGAKLQEFRRMLWFLTAAHAKHDVAAHLASSEQYGAPKTVLFNYTLRQLARKCATVQAACKDARIQEALEFLEPLVVKGKRDITFSWDAIELPTAIVDDGPALSAQQIREMQQAALKSLGIADAIEVHIRPTCGKATFSFDVENGMSEIPSDEDLAIRSMSPTAPRMRALIQHELATHAARAVRGSRSPLGLLGIGLDNYLEGEEGVATYRAQMVTGTREFAGVGGYRAVCLAIGMDGKPRTFRQLYEVLWRISLIAQVDGALYHQQRIDMDSIDAKSRLDAWDSTLSTYRGTTGTTPGACYTKSLVYLRGNIYTWQLLGQDPSWEHKFNIGKYDATNGLHVGILHDLDLL